jgi:hypothetical protein
VVLVCKLHIGIELNDIRDTRGVLDREMWCMNKLFLCIKKSENKIHEQAFVECIAETKKTLYKQELMPELVNKKN